MRICELFAGVGGFRVGFENASDEFETVFFNQWEPSSKNQFAYNCYVNHYPLDTIDVAVRDYTNLDIHQVPKHELPDFDLLCGGFPCQNYSVAGPKSSRGIEGSKGVLWWDIRQTLEAKNPKFVLLENVDRLLKSPASQRGRDFGIILKCFDELDYFVEWRVINAADYGEPQRRRRIFIFAYKNNSTYSATNTNFFNSVFDFNNEIDNRQVFLNNTDSDFFGAIFPCTLTDVSKEGNIGNLDLTTLSNTFKFKFENSGFMRDGKIYTRKVEPIIEEISPIYNILLSTNDESYFIDTDEEKYAKWVALKGSKRRERISKEGYAYTFSEGSIAFPEPEDQPARTMLTSEGTLNRSSLTVRDPQNGRIRTILPEEAELIQTFPVGWTAVTNDDGKPIMTKRQRLFCMGNALVTNLVKRMGENLIEIYHNEE